MLLDCGNGVFGKLREHVDYTDVDAVVICHVHADHFIDLIPYSYALLLTPAPATGAGGRPSGHRRPGPAAPDRAARGAPRYFAPSSAPGATRS